MLRSNIKRLFNGNLFNRLENVYKNSTNDLPLIRAISANKIHFMSSTRFVLPSTVKVEFYQLGFHVDKRLKSKKAKPSSKQQDDSDDEEEEEDDNDNYEDELSGKDSKIIKIEAISSRLDYVLKRGFGISRNKIETYFYESKFRINGKKVLKKSIMIQDGDVLDYIKGNDPINPANLTIARLEIKDVTPRSDTVRITARLFPTLVIEDYDNKQLEKLS